MRDLIDGDAWVALLGLVLLPWFGWVLWHSADMSALERGLHLYGIGSLRSSWAVYCSHALSHGRWRKWVGANGSARFNVALAAVNFGTLFGVYPNYWLFHTRHHTHLGAYTLLEARERAAKGQPTDGDLGLSRIVLHSAPSRKYSVALEEATATDASPLLATGRHGVEFLPRLGEGAFQVQSVVLHLLAPLLFLGSAASRSVAPRALGAIPSINSSIAVQSASQLAGWLLVAWMCIAVESPWPWLMYAGSQWLWLSPLNPNFLWTSPHLCTPGSLQPTVSFYTPQHSVLGAAIDLYMGYENYHVEHHDVCTHELERQAGCAPCFCVRVLTRPQTVSTLVHRQFPDVPQYLLPRLREIAPEHYDGLRSMPVLDAATWQDVLGGEFFYACQDTSFGGRGRDARSEPVPET